MFTFIKENPNFVKFTDGSNSILAVSYCIETLNVSDTYDDYGQKISAVVAGDSIELKTDFSAKKANELAIEHKENVEAEYKIGDIICAWDNSDLYEDLIDTLEEDVDFLYYKSTVKGFNYWDGHNWKTVTIDQEHGEPSHVEINKELANELNNVIKKMNFIKEDFGKRIYETEDYQIIEPDFLSHFEDYIFLEKSFN